MTFYTAAMTDVIAYIDTAHYSVAFVEPPSTANKSIINCLKKSSLINSLNHKMYVYVCTHDLYLF